MLATIPSISQPSQLLPHWFYQTVLMVNGTSSSTQSSPTKRAHHHTSSTHELERVYFSHYDILVRSARLLVDDVSTAADVVQEAFVKALTAQPRFTNDDAVAYMKTAVMNQARSTLRKRGVSRKHLSVVPVEETNVATQTTEELPVDASIIHAALGNLSQRQRECVMLFHTHSMTHKEIAKTLEISEGSVKQHLSRGLKNLNEALGGAL